MERELQVNWQRIVLEGFEPNIRPFRAHDGWN